MGGVKKMDHIAITVRDIDESRRASGKGLATVSARA